MIDVGGMQSSMAALAVALLLAFSPGQAAAHGGLSIDKDVCKLKLGSYSMHFTGYQPGASGSKEFCEDIPQTGVTVVALDAIDPVLREMPIEVRILRDTGDDGNLEASTVLHLAPKLYPTGSVSFEHTFDQPGNFVGLIAAGDKGQYVSRFPFSVAKTRPAYEIYLLILAVPLLGFLLFRYSGRARRVAARPASSRNTGQ